MRHRTEPEFWEAFNALPVRIQRLAYRNFELLKANERHPSLHFKKVTRDTWSVRVGLDYRALAAEDGADLVWFWIGPHDEYDAFVGGE